MDDDLPAIEQPEAPVPEAPKVKPTPAPQFDYRAFAGVGGFGGLSGGAGLTLGGQKVFKGKVLRTFSGATVVFPLDNDAFFDTVDSGITTLMVIPDGGIRVEPFTHWTVAPTIGVSFGYALVLLFDQANAGGLPGLGSAITVTASIGGTYHLSDKMHLDAELVWRPMWLVPQTPSTFTSAQVGLRF